MIDKEICAAFDTIVWASLISKVGSHTSYSDQTRLEIISAEIRTFAYKLVGKKVVQKFSSTIPNLITRDFNYYHAKMMLEFPLTSIDLQEIMTYPVIAKFCDRLEDIMASLEIPRISGDNVIPLRRH